jgi:hypothetical protein
MTRGGEDAVAMEVYSNMHTASDPVQRCFFQNLTELAFARTVRKSKLHMKILRNEARTSMETFDSGVDSSAGPL